jgi:hypothetical protein
MQILYLIRVSSDPEVSNSSPRSRILPSRRLGHEMFLGFDFPGFRLGLVNYWACQKLTHDPTGFMLSIR